MEVVKYKKKKSNIYEVSFSDGSIYELYDDVIIKFSLLIKKKFTKKDLDDILKYNNSLKAYYLALKYITVKIRCEKEVEEFLKKKDVSSKDISNTILKLKNDGYLNKELYIKSYINDAFNLKQDGPLKTKKNLLMLGFKEEEIIPYLNLDYELKVKNIIDKRLKSNKLSRNMFIMKMKMYLINLGYSLEMFIDYLNNVNIIDSDKIKKDFNILLRKYEKKYDKDKLYYFIKDKLYKKGYNSDEIGEVINEMLL